MIRFTPMAACAALLAGIAPLAACASASDTTTTAASTQTAQPAPTAPSPTTAYSDAQIQSYIAARDAIAQLSPGATAEEQRQNQTRIGEVLQQNNLTPDVYNAIATRAQTDQTLANRIAAASVGDTLSVAQLQAFIAASDEIQPLNQQLATATPEQRTALAERIRAALARNNLELEVYNGIAAQAQSDAEVAARIAALRTGQTPLTTP
jgi:hypothetical protein